MKITGLRVLILAPRENHQAGRPGRPEGPKEPGREKRAIGYRLSVTGVAAMGGPGRRREAGVAQW